MHQLRNAKNVEVPAAGWHPPIAPDKIKPGAVSGAQIPSKHLRQDFTAQAGIIHNLPALASDGCMGLPCSVPVPFVLVVFWFFGRSAICFVFILLVVFFTPLRQVFSLGSLGCHGTCSVDQAGLQLRDPPACLSNAGLKVLPPEFFFFFFFWIGFHSILGRPGPHYVARADFKLMAMPFP